MAQRKNITYVGSKSISEKPYYLFHIKEWKKLSVKIAPKESANPRGFLTNMFLLQHTAELPDLLIKSEAEYRLYTELKRMAGSVSLNDNEQDHAFKYEDSIISLEDGNIILYDADGERLGSPYSIEAFMKHPQAVFSNIKELLFVEDIQYL